MADTRLSAAHCAAVMTLFIVVTLLAATNDARIGNQAGTRRFMPRGPAARVRGSLLRLPMHSISRNCGNKIRIGKTYVNSSLSEYKVKSPSQGLLRREYGASSFKSPNDLMNYLVRTGLDISDWGKGTSKTVEYLWNELREGESVLINDGQTLLRQVKVVRVLVKRSLSNPMVLLEKAQVLADGRIRHRGTVLAEKMKAHEDPLRAARRGLGEELEGAISPNDITDLSLSHRRESEVRSSISYPNLKSSYEIFEANAIIPSLPSGEFFTDEKHDGISSKRIYWNWHDTRISEVPRGKSKHPVAVLDLHKFLSGTWSFSRTLESAGEKHKMEGNAEFVEGHTEKKNANRLVYTETGEMIVKGIGVNTTRQLAYDFIDGSNIASVLFMDGPSEGDIFHDLNLSTGKWQATHYCGEDVYTGTITVHNSKEGKLSYETKWNVVGPKKSQFIHTVYTGKKVI